MDKLEYKGYYGSIEYSQEDNCTNPIRNPLQNCDVFRKNRNKHQCLHPRFDRKKTGTYALIRKIPNPLSSKDLHNM